MAKVDDLSVRVSAATADFQAGMSTASRGLSSLREDAVRTAGRLQLLQSRMNEAGDEAGRLATRSLAASGSLGAMGASAATTQVAVATLSTLTMASLVPAILTLTTTIAPLLAALGGFVTVAGSIAGVGLVGFLGAALTNTDKLKSAFEDLTGTIQSEFAPVFDVFAGVLVNLINELTSVIPQLVPAQDVVRRIANQFEALGMAIIGALPAFVDLAVEMTDRFLPPFVALVEDVLPKAPGYFRSLVTSMQSVWSVLQPLVSAFGGLRPEITRFGMIALEELVPALTTLVNAFGGVLEYITSLDRETQSLIARYSMLAPILGGAAVILGGSVVPALAGAAAAAIALSAPIAALSSAALAFQRDFLGVRTEANQVAQVLRAELPWAFERLQSTGRAILSTLSAAWAQHGAQVSAAANRLVGAIGTRLTGTVEHYLRRASAALATIGSMWRQHGSRVRTTVMELTAAFQQVLFHGMTAATAIVQGEMTNAEVAVTRFKVHTLDLMRLLAAQLPAPVRQALTRVQQLWAQYAPQIQTSIGWISSSVSGLVADVRSLWPEMQQLGTAIGSTLLNRLRMLGSLASDVLTWFGSLDRSTQLLVAKIGLLTPIVARLGMIFGGPLLSALTTIAPLLAGSLVGSFAALAGWVTSLVGTVAGLGGTLTSLGVTLSTLSPTLGLIISSIASGVATVSSFVAGFSGLTATLTSLGVTISTVSPTLGGLLSAILTGATTLAGFLGPLTGIVSTFGSLVVTLGSVLGPIGLVVAAIGTLGYAFKENEDLVLSFANRAIGILQDVVRNAATWIQTNGPELIGRAFRAIGEGLRFIALDIYNAITGNGDSILKTIITDIASWLITKGPGILKSAAAFAFEAITTAVLEFGRGLIWGSLIPDMFADIVDYIRGVDLQAAMYAILNASYLWIKNTAVPQIVGVVDDMMSDVLSAIEDIDVVGAMRDIFDGAGSAASSAFESAFNAAIPSSVGLPSTEIAGQTIGGGSISLPQLDTGGYIESGGVAQLHSGERVVPAARVDRDGGGGGDSYRIDMEVYPEAGREGEEIMESLERELSSGGI